MQGREVYVLGVGMSRFGEPGLTLAARAFEAGAEALADAGIGFDEVGCTYAGSAFAPPSMAVRIVKELGLGGAPVQRVENASATGAAAFHEAVLAVSSGRVETALALAFDDPGTAPLSDWQHGVLPYMETLFTPPVYFALQAVRRMHERGTTAETLAAIAAKNWNMAAFNPKAQRRSPTEVTVEQVLASRTVVYPHTARMAAPAGPGAAAAVVCSAEALARLGGGVRIGVAAAQNHSERPVADHLALGATSGPPELSRRAAQAAYEEASLGPDALDLVAVHDAYAIEELLYYEDLGLCAEGEGDRLVADGETDLGGRIPVSTDGGLIGRGHPVGPTGLAQVWELTLQLRGEAGARQVEGAKVGLAHIAGSGAVCFAHVLRRD
jgi:acetyl-CoA acetyltransferase